MYRIILSFLLFSTFSAYANSDSKCFVLNKQKYIFAKLNDKGAHSITQVANEDLSRWFFCFEVHSTMKCSGEDDSGSFSVADGQILLESGVFLGGPDGPSLKLKHEDPLELKSCD